MGCLKSPGSLCSSSAPLCQIGMAGIVGIMGLVGAAGIAGLVGVMGLVGKAGMSGIVGMLGMVSKCPTVLSRASSMAWLSAQEPCSAARSPHLGVSVGKSVAQLLSSAQLLACRSACAHTLLEHAT